MDVIGRFLDPPRGSFFLFGPRGTGKSTWLGRVYPDAFRVDLLDAAALREYAARPERLAEQVRAQPVSRRIVVDEVQRVPDLLPVAHSLMEEDRRRRFVLTGSSSRKLKRGGVDLLAGRALLRRMHPFTAAELGTAFRLESALEVGLLPVVLGSDDPAGTLRSYAALYVREEVQAEGLVRRIGDFSRFLEAISFSQGQVLNVANVARDCAVGRRTVEGHLSILEDLLLAFRVPVFTRRARRAVTVHPKFYFADVGIFRSLRPAGPLDRPAEIDGQALEGLVAQHLRAWIDYRDRGDGLYFWRTRAGSEVDFVVYGRDGLTGIEVKSAARIGGADLRGIRSFLDEYPSAATILLHRGRDAFVREGVPHIPVGRFLAALHPRRSLGETVRRAREA